MTDDMEILQGSGNIFADLGDADAETRRLKAQVAAAIIAALNARRLSLRQGAEATRLDQADLQRIRSGDLSRFTLDRLVRVACRLSQKVTMKVVPVRAVLGLPAGDRTTPGE